jgi:hypothetical protein
MGVALSMNQKNVLFTILKETGGSNGPKSALKRKEIVFLIH